MSSNLIARSIFICIFFALSLLSNESETIYTLQKKYIFSEHTLFSTDLIPEIPHRFEILKIPPNRHQHKVRSYEIINRFEKKGYKVISDNAPVITFNKQIQYDSNRILNTIAEKYLNAYARYRIIINDIHIEPTSHMDLSGFTIRHIDFPDNLLKRNRGSFGVTFWGNDKKQKKIYFRYNITATLEVYKASEKMNHHVPLNPLRIRKERILFKQVSSPLLTEEYLQGYQTKRYIQKNSIITQSHVERIPAIKKKAKTVAFFSEGGIRIETEVQALEDGHVGQSIRVTTPDGKIFHGIVNKQGAVEIQ